MSLKSRTTVRSLLIWATLAVIACESAHSAPVALDAMQGSRCVRPMRLPDVFADWMLHRSIRLGARDCLTLHPERAVLPQRTQPNPRLEPQLGLRASRTGVGFTLNVRF